MARRSDQLLHALAYQAGAFCMSAYADTLSSAFQAGHVPIAVAHVEWVGPGQVAINCDTLELVASNTSRVFSTMTGSLSAQINDALVRRGHGRVVLVLFPNIQELLQGDEPAIALFDCASYAEAS